MIVYLDEVLIPKMLIKLRQGVGRLIRSETDSGVISILDSRAAPT
ncbi:helicase C-terminal domain-containing protein [Fusibacter sp. 3D3]|nr:helicase C-terminal domain-containing protein [Fusibacter sp. 3D3]GAU79054.1 DinG family ATP-dependent helicase YoaA [Fusibacter sp. 3D3]